MLRNTIRHMASLMLFMTIMVYVIFLNGCSDNEPVLPDQPQTLITYDTVFTRTKADINILISLAGLEDLASYLLYDITVYHITYKTDYLGQEITASGLVAFPDSDQGLPLLSFQHGTITKHTDAPTLDINLYGLLCSIASTGYIFCIPDFLGFGSSSNILHPYYHAESIATSIIDMIKASKELSEILHFNFNGKVFLAGYSEGGYATMAAHKMMEEEPLNGLNLIASAPAAGGYDIKGMQEYFFSLETYHEPYYLAYVSMSYRQVYGFEDILTDIFQEPYASEIPDYFDGTLSGNQINDALTDVMADLLQPDILANINTDSKYDYLNDVFEMNSLDNWVPQTKMVMYHGTADITVPYQNSVNTYNKMLQLGASQNTLSFVPLEGDTHDSGVYPYLAHVITTFNSLK